MATERIIPGEIRIFLNHIYEFKKGVRNMVLYTMSREHEEFAIRRLKNQKISYMIQEVGRKMSEGKQINNIGWNFHNTYKDLPKPFYSEIKLSPVRKLELIILNEPLAKI